MTLNPRHCLGGRPGSADLTHKQEGPPTTSVLFSAAEPYVDAAINELKNAFQRRMLSFERLGPDTCLVHTVGVAAPEIFAASYRIPLVFVRHLVDEVARVRPLEDEEYLVDELVERIQELTGQHGHSHLSLQAWSTGRTPIGAEHLRFKIADRLSDGLGLARAGKPNILALCVTPREVVLGFTKRTHALSDWPGGRVRLSRRPDQVSRAEFKLEELLKVGGVRFPKRGTAVDLGASPGGWTRVLRDAGLKVHAVDPADLDPRVARDSGVLHERTTAGRFLSKTRVGFDVAVSDMKMEPRRSCETLLQVADHLSPEGVAVLTLKLTPRRALAVVRASMTSLRARYTISFARQLYHNRNEVTVVLRPLSPYEPRGPDHRPRPGAG